MKTKLTVEQKAAWIKALRTCELPDGTKIQQGTGALRRQPNANDTPALCCLGVLCEVLDVPKVRIDEYCGEFMYGISSIQEAPYNTKGHSSAVLPAYVAKATGISGSGGFDSSLVTWNEDDSLAIMNDNGKSFSDIADVIEKVFDSI